MTVNNVPVGTQFNTRIEVREAGLHAPPMAYIYPAGDGARAEPIVISGGYSDDRDYGDVIIYTGAGGQSAPGSGVQIADQKIEGANKAGVLFVSGRYSCLWLILSLRS